MIGLPTATVCEDLTLWSKVPRKGTTSNYTRPKPTDTTCILNCIMGERDRHEKTIAFFK